jgi:hypothetical protein
LKNEKAVEYINKYDIHKGKDILKRIYIASDTVDEIPNIKTNLWYVDENEWENLDEIQNLIKRVQEK